MRCDRSYRDDGSESDAAEESVKVHLLKLGSAANLSWKSLRVRVAVASGTQRSLTPDLRDEAKSNRSAIGEIARWGHPGIAAKVVDHVRLIVVACGVRNR